MLQEKVVTGLSGWLMVVVLLGVEVGGVVLLANSGPVHESVGLVALVVLALAISVICWFGLTVVNPNTAKVLLLFGAYKGSIKTPGFCWVNPLTARRTVSLR